MYPTGYHICKKGRICGQPGYPVQFHPRYKQYCTSITQTRHDILPNTPVFAVAKNKIEKGKSYKLQIEGHQFKNTPEKTLPVGSKYKAIQNLSDALTKKERAAEKISAIIICPNCSCTLDPKQLNSTTKKSNTIDFKRRTTKNLSLKKLHERLLKPAPEKTEGKKEKKDVEQKSRSVVKNTQVNLFWY